MLFLPIMRLQRSEPIHNTQEHTSTPSKPSLMQQTVIVPRQGILHTTQSNQSIMVSARSSDAKTLRAGKKLISIFTEEALLDFIHFFLCLGEGNAAGEEVRDEAGLGFEEKEGGNHF